ncbi:MAG: TSUP family transporter [Pikeienuella sp.]|uniref:TSUP family transporter n=1 Tax=Pikeienuella sp. TaxID=2831957 RepID=UPI00391888FB
MDAILWLAPFVFLLAGTIKGALGIGLPTTVIAILSQVADPRLAVAIGLMPIIFSNLWQTYREGEWRKTLARFWPFSLALGVTIFIFADIAADVSAATIIMATGVGVVIFAAANLIRRPPPLPARWERPTQVAVGVAAGVMGGFTGLWAPPLVILLLSLRLDKTDFVRATGLLLLLGALPMLAGYAQSGLITAEVFLWSVAMILPTFLGFSVGERARRRMADARFQKALLIFFLLMGLNMIRRGLEG